jgi:FlaA1/EpsC-like NDP-sugar epimerase
MTELVLKHPRNDAKTIVKASMERMTSIDAYTDEGQRIVGKQEATITGGNGARMIVNIPEAQRDDEETVIDVNAEKEVSIDMSTNPEDIKSEFLEIVNDLRDQDIDTILDRMSDDMSPDSSKEVASSTNFQDSQSTLGKRFIITFTIVMLFSLLFGLFMMSMMMP